MFVDYDRDKAGYQFVNSTTWLDSEFSNIKLKYAVGLDGLSLPLALLTAFLGLVSVLISWRIELRPREDFAWLLVLETSLLGVFSALDFVLFFLFWEIELVPMYFLISVWGSGNRVYSAWKYVLYTFFGSALMLVGILTLGFTADTFDIRQLARIGDINDAIIPTWAILKRLIAYSSVSHMGYVLLGASAIGTVGLTGASMQMLTHGLITGMLFVLVGMVYDRAHTRNIADLSGLAPRMPFIAVMMVVAGLASLGLPALAGFVSEVTVFLGTFEKHEVMTIAGVIGIVFAAGYILWTIQRVFWGAPDPRWESLVDATAWWERGPLLAMTAAIVAIGIYPAVMMDLFESGVTPIAQRLG